jgi:hypothetical protein
LRQEKHGAQTNTPGDDEGVLSAVRIRERLPQRADQIDAFTGPFSREQIRCCSPDLEDYRDRFIPLVVSRKSEGTSEEGHRGGAHSHSQKLSGQRLISGVPTEGHLMEVTAQRRVGNDGGLESGHFSPALI